MKRYFIALLALALLMGGYDLPAQNKSTGTSTKSTKTAKGKSSNNTSIVPKANDGLTTLPENSNDCLYAIPLELDVPYGPTTPPNGAGRIQEIMRDKSNPNVFEYEHNSVWFKFTVPYNGDLNFFISQQNPWDNYDFLVYKYTDVYFSNHIIQGKIRPVAACLSPVDTVAISEFAPLRPAGKGTKVSSKSSSGSNATRMSRRDAMRPLMGMDSTGTSRFIGPRCKGNFAKPISVKKGEVYYIVLDNQSSKGEGFTIRASIAVDCFRPTVQFYDPREKKIVDVDLLILEKNTDNRPIVKNARFRSGKVNLVPGFDYTLYAKKDGYFAIYKEFNANICKEDTLLRFLMQQAKIGTTFPLSDIYFSDEVELLGASDTALMQYVSMFRNYPELQFRIKGYVQSYGIDMDRDIQISQQRANVVRQFFEDHGVAPDRMTTCGMTQNELKRSAAAALNKSQPFNDAKVEIIITAIKK